MSKAEKKDVVMIIGLVISIIVWIGCVLFFSSSFNSINSVSIYGTMVQGMSALLSVSIAVIIFRIQSLENRLHSLEESTRNYIFQITHNTYPKWLSCLEEHIRSGIITEKYLQKRKTGSASKKYTTSELEKDRDDQQNRLMESLNEHVNIEQTIQRTRNGAYRSFVLLILPILVSFFLLIVSDGFENWVSFYFVSTVILLSILGIFSLIKTTIDSTVTK